MQTWALIAPCKRTAFLAFLKQGSLDLCASARGAVLPAVEISNQTRSSLAAGRWDTAEDRTKSQKGEQAVIGLVRANRPPWLS